MVTKNQILGTNVTEGKILNVYNKIFFIPKHSTDVNFTLTSRVQYLYADLFLGFLPFDLVLHLTLLPFMLAKFKSTDYHTKYCTLIVATYKLAHYLVLFWM